MVQRAVDEIILQKNEKLSVEDKTREKINDEVDEDEIYELDKISLNENKWRDFAFDSEPNFIYDTKIMNDLNHIHDNKVNNIAECNLIHDILNPPKLTQNINSHYSPIIHGCINTCKSRVIL